MVLTALFVNIGNRVSAVQSPSSLFPSTSNPENLERSCATGWRQRGRRGYPIPEACEVTPPMADSEQLLCAASRKSVSNRYPQKIATPSGWAPISGSRRIVEFRLFAVQRPLQPLQRREGFESPASAPTVIAAPAAKQTGNMFQPVSGFRKILLQGLALLRSYPQLLVDHDAFPLAFGYPNRSHHLQGDLAGQFFRRGETVGGVISEVGYIAFVRRYLIYTSLQHSQSDFQGARVPDSIHIFIRGPRADPRPIQIERQETR
jgi:hypothetical protein